MRNPALSLERQKPARRDPHERAHDFDEIDSGLTPAQALVEAQRCVQCSDAPCRLQGCPLRNDIPRWIDHVVHGRLHEAALVLAQTAPMPEMCGRLCPQERLCESRCVVGRVSQPVAIGALEAYVGRVAEQRGWFVGPRPAPTGHRIAIVGSGPAGLAAADRLLDLGHAVVLFERQPAPGGVPVYGIPNFKYAKKRVASLVERVRAKGGEFHCSVDVGRDVTIEELRDPGGFAAVLLATGAPKGRGLDVPGAHLEGIYSATEFLVNGNLPPALLAPGERRLIGGDGRCAVIGGGDTSADCVRTAVRLGHRDVVCVYRRSPEEIPGRAADRGYAVEEGVRYEYLATPIRFEGRGRVERMVCVRMGLGEPDASGRRAPVQLPGSEFALEVDTVVLSLGYELDTAFLVGAGCATDGGRLRVEGLRTSLPGVFAAGDVVNGADLVVTAARDGRDAALEIDRWLREERVP